VAQHIVAAGMNLNHNDEISYQYIEKALALEPQNILARSLLSYYYAQKEDSSGAYKEIMTVIQDLKKFIPLAQFFISQGIEKKYFDNGSVEFKAKFVNGRPEGAYKVFFPTGKIKEEGQYKNGQLQGWGTVYYPKGSIFISFEHDNGQLIELTQYDESGGIVEQFSLGK
jgi:antitoxin component YwqK of YwqJK toxin-antitoxin module